jgi:hypothetical protein
MTRPTIPLGRASWREPRRPCSAWDTRTAVTPVAASGQCTDHQEVSVDIASRRSLRRGAALGSGSGIFIFSVPKPKTAETDLFALHCPLGLGRQRRRKSLLQLVNGVVMLQKHLECRHALMRRWKVEPPYCARRWLVFKHLGFGCVGIEHGTRVELPRLAWRPPFGRG